MAAALFAVQDSFGKKAWTEYARTAGVPDISRFTECMKAESTVAAIANDLSLARRLDVGFTPTLLINGWRYPTSLGPDSIKRLAQEVIAGRAPFPRRKGINASAQLIKRATQ